MAEQVWRKSPRSVTGANCLEMACAPDGIRIRDSKIPASPQLLFTMTSWERFLHHVVVRLL